MSLTPDELGQKIKEAQKKKSEPTGPKVDRSSYGGKSMRAAIDFTSAIVIGILLGYWIDRWLGTKPFGVIVFLVLGFIAGVMNIQRAQMEDDKEYEKEKKEDNDENKKP